MERLPFDPDRAVGPEPADAPARRDARYRHRQEAEHLTVGQVAELIKTTLEQRVPSPLRVIGEVSNLSRPNHWYFSLKDDKAVLNCVAWASAVKKFRFVPTEGGEVVATGHISHYGPQGRTQLYVTALRAVGAGALDLMFRQMCDELRKLGYFDESRKKSLPVFPRRIAVVTSQSSAAWQDVIATARQRCNAVGLLLADVRVQGEGAAEQVAVAIRRIDTNRETLGVDAILVTRGGGSAEDLWTFNERAVADAAFACALPIVAAIGHESDTTVIELVADVRAATPTQAVMRLIPASSQLLEQVHHLDHRLTALMRRLVERQRERLAVITRATLFRDPGSLVMEAKTAIGRHHRDLRRVLRARVIHEQARLERLVGRLQQLRPEALASKRRQRLAVLDDRLRRALRRRVDRRQLLQGHRQRLGQVVRANCRRITERLDAMSRQLVSIGPERVLGRGFSYTTTARGDLIRSAQDVRGGQHIVTRVADGSFGSIVDGPKDRTKRPASPDQMDLFSRSE
ncbi:MAG: exodeoxyribonuclease VII large subunit [Phycisphaerales bacterium]